MNGLKPRNLVLLLGVSLLLWGGAQIVFASPSMCKATWSVKLPWTGENPTGWGTMDDGVFVEEEASCEGDCVVGFCTERLRPGSEGQSSDPGCPAVEIEVVDCVCWGDQNGDGVIDDDEWITDGLDECRGTFYRSVATGQKIGAVCMPQGCDPGYCDEHTWHEGHDPEYDPVTGELLWCKWKIYCACVQ